MTDDSTRHLPPPGFGAVLAAARHRRGWSQRTAAARIGVSNGYLAMLETDRRAPSRTVAEALIETLDLSGDDADIVDDAAVEDAGRDYPGHDLSPRYRTA